MADLSDFKRGQIVGARMAENAELFSVARKTASIVMSAFEKEGKAFSLKQNSRRFRKLSDRDRQIIQRVVWNDHKYSAPKITEELNEHLANSVSSKTVRRELHKAGFYRKAAIRKTY